MAQKSFSITQTVNLNGAISTRYGNVVCDENEIDTITSQLEGEYKVMSEHSSGGSDAVVSSYNIFDAAYFKAENTANMRGNIYTNKGGLIIKNTVGPDEMTAIISALHPFEDDPTKKPLVSSIKTNIYAGATASSGE